MEESAGAVEKKGRSKKKLLPVILVLLLACAAGVWFILIPALDATPSMMLRFTGEAQASGRSEIVVDVVVSNLPAGEYPAASISVAFDPEKLEFVSVRQGTMGAKSARQSGSLTVPVWSADPQISNLRGFVNAMYLDITGGERAYVTEGFEKGSKDVLVRMVFRLRDTAVSGDAYEISITDAVLATSDNRENHNNLASADGTLKTVPVRISVK